ncbi:hypothetical protein BOX15_Mlig002899g2, partial [Macrostomum lignano]
PVSNAATKIIGSGNFASAQQKNAAFSSVLSSATASSNMNIFSPTIVSMKREVTEPAAECAGASASASSGSHSSRGATPLMDTLRDDLESDVSVEARERVCSILDSVRSLSDLEKLLLYLQLPGGGGAPGDQCLSGQSQHQQPLQLSNQAEQAHAHTWILSHLEEDPTVCLRKDEVYSDYKQYCEAHGCKPLNTADFGKAMKRAFPGVKPRRLGQRGQSKYCYGGLRKQACPPQPRLTELLAPSGSLATAAAAAAAQQASSDEDCSLSSGGGGLHDSVVVQWAQKLLGTEFSSMRSLAEHLVTNQYVSPCSAPALSVLACRLMATRSQQHQAAQNSSLSSSPPAAHSGRRRGREASTASSTEAAAASGHQAAPQPSPPPLPGLLLPSPYRSLRRPLPPPSSNYSAAESDEDDLAADQEIEGYTEEAMEEDPVGHTVGRGLAMVSPEPTMGDDDNSNTDDDVDGGVKFRARPPAGSPPLLDWCLPASPVRPLRVQLPTDAAAAVIIPGGGVGVGATVDEFEQMDIVAVGR